jgi:indoleamine 2,3-dioxygenase
MIGTQFTRRGFLPEPDPVVEFPAGSEFSALDSLGRDLPSLLQDKGFRALARGLVDLVQSWVTKTGASDLF